MFREKYKNLTEDGKSFLRTEETIIHVIKNALEIKSD